MVVFEDAVLPVSALELPLEFVVGAVLLASAVEKALVEVAAIVLLGVLDGEAVSLGEVIFEASEVAVLLLVELAVAQFVPVFVQLAAEDRAFRAAVDGADCDIAGVFLPEPGNFFQQGAVVDVQILLQVGQFHHHSALATILLPHDNALYLQSPHHPPTTSTPRSSRTTTGSTPACWRSEWPNYVEGGG